MIPLSFGQRYVWQRMQEAPIEQTLGVNLVRLWRIPDGVRQTDVRDALIKLTGLHEALRTSYREDTRPVQVLHDRYEPPLEVLRTDDPRAVAASEAAKPFDLAVPTWRALLLTSEDGVDHLALVAHHLTADRTAMAVLADDFLTVLAGRTPEPVAQPREVVAVQQAWGPRNDAAIEYWRGQVRTMPSALFPGTTHPLSSNAPRLRLKAVSREAAGPARRTAAEQGVSVSHLLLAELARDLHERTGETPHLMITSANRLLPSWQRSVGSFVQFVPVRIEPGSNARAVKGALLRAMRHGCHDVDVAAQAGHEIEAERGVRLNLEHLYNFMEGRLSGGNLMRSTPPADDLHVTSGPARPLGPTFYLRAKVLTELSLELRVDTAALDHAEAEDLLLTLCERLSR
ncbi:condensation domain-containing protein [Lentzea sp. BCCO 10_0856]|uniref:Condensation domain-containing protein n=2 Tax=Lentzea miocenica TaxID=3095431 RepID=A0ABU4T6Y1_9PSEU|nr:condensation domain-containing protein [Lentzea sp. BCCO 10_0856]